MAKAKKKSSKSSTKSTKNNAKSNKSRTVLAENLEKAFKKGGLSKNTLADDAGVSRSQLYDVLAARKGASVDWIDRVAAALEVEPYTLLRAGR